MKNSLGAKPNEVQLSPVELALVNSVPGVPFCDSSGGECAIVRRIMQEVAAFGREPKEIKEPTTETEIAEYKLARKVRRAAFEKKSRRCSRSEKQAAIPPVAAHPLLPVAIH